MSPLDLYREATAAGLSLEPQGGQLAVQPAERLTPELAARLREHKAELLAWLSSPPCPGAGAVPPDDLPLVPVRPAPTPRDRERVIAFLLRQGANHPSPLAAWLERRESAYYGGPGRHWDCALFSYAAARDAGCWQIRKSERDLWLFLCATEEVRQAQTEWRGNVDRRRALQNGASFAEKRRDGIARMEQECREEVRPAEPSPSDQLPQEPGPGHPIT
jgi:hypothetical protein